MTMLRVASQTGERTSDGVEQGRGLGRVGGGPDDKHDHGGPREELPSETTALALGSAASHLRVLLSDGFHVLLSMTPATDPNGHALTVHLQCTTRVHSAVTMHFA